MLSEISAVWSWVDFLIGFILVRGVFIGALKGTYVEVFKTLGVVFSVFISLHYYKRVAWLLEENVGSPQAASGLLSFILLWVAVTLFFMILREGISLAVKKDEDEEISFFDRLGGILLSLVRVYLTCGLIFTGFFLVNAPALWGAAERSVLGPYVAESSTDLYCWAFENMISPVFPEEEADPSFLNLPQKNGKKKKAVRKKRNQFQIDKSARD